jgi:hypothetical protein
MKAQRMQKLVTVLAAVLLAAPAYAAWPTVVDPAGPNSGASHHPFTGEPDSGAGRGLTLAAEPTAVDPTGPNSGAGRTLALAMFPTEVDPAGPNSGAGNHPFTGEPDSGAGRGLV